MSSQLATKSYIIVKTCKYRGRSMKTALIYLYGILLVLRSIPKLRVLKKISATVPYVDKANQIYQVPTNIARKVVERTKSTVTVTGREQLPNEPVLFVANHQGMFDILVLLGYLDKPIGFIAKREIKKIPVMSQWMEEMNCVFIDRSNRRAALKVIDDGVDSLLAGQSMVIFPEGTRSKGSQVNEFKSGSLRLATRALVPIVPVTIDGTHRILEGNDGKIKAANVHVTIGEAIYSEQYKNVKHNQLAKQLQKIIEETIAKKSKM